MDLKQFSYQVKDLDDKKGIVVAYANSYNFEDHHGDISDPGSFIKTVKEMRRRIRVLKDHNPTIGLGVPKEIDAQDPFGLLTTTQFNMNKEVSRDMLTDIILMQENDLNAELSIGYDVIRRDENDTRRIKEYRLWEYSFLTSWGANQLSTVEGVKTVQGVYGFMELAQKAYNLPYSDPRLRQLEALLKSLDAAPGQEPPTPQDEPKVDAADFANKILLTYKNLN